MRDDYSVCLCPACHMPLFDQTWGIELERSVTCGVCGWTGVAGDTKLIPVNDWRAHILDPKQGIEGLQPLPRTIFRHTYFEDLARITQGLGLFMAKWGLVTVDDTKAEEFSLYLRRAAMMFAMELGANLMRKDRAEPSGDYGQAAEPVLEEPAAEPSEKEAN